MKCSLCLSEDVRVVHQKEDPHLGTREYAQCLNCKLLFLLPQYFLPSAEEKERYDLHQNSPDDPGYVDFLNQLIKPLSRYLKEGSQGLDYGCGPGPTVSVLMEKAGFSVDNFDPIYFPNDQMDNKKYDFVTVTEVVEHFYNAREEFERLHSLLRANAFLGIMTGIYNDIERFKSWWYHSEPTHVCFYHQETIQYISKWLNYEILLNTDRVVIFKKK